MASLSRSTVQHLRTAMLEDTLSAMSVAALSNTSHMSTMDDRVALRGSPLSCTRSTSPTWSTMSLVSSCTSAALLQPRDRHFWPCVCFDFGKTTGGDFRLASEGLTGRLGLLGTVGLPGLGMGAGLEDSSSCAVLSFHHGEECPCAVDIVALLCNSSFGSIGGGEGVLCDVVVLLFPGGGGRLPFGVKIFWPPVVGGNGGGGRLSGGGDNGRCGSLGADGCCCDCENTGTLGGCGLRGGPFDLDRSSTRGG